MLLAVSVPRWGVEWSLTLSIVAVVVIAMIWPRTATVGIAILLCVAAIGFREFAIAAGARAMIRERQAAQTWTREYSEGVLDLRDYSVGTGRYTLLGGCGLALLAVRLFSRKARQGTPS